MNWLLRMCCFENAIRWGSCRRWESAVCLRVVLAAGDGVDDVGHDGVVVVFGDRAARSHAVALGDSDRGQVVSADDREEFRGAHDLEAVLFARLRCFRRVA